MKVAIVSLNKKPIEKALKKEGFKIVTKNPDLVVSFGGDGTFLFSEQVFPGIPKLLIRHSQTCSKCHNHNFKKIISALKEKKYKIVDYPKLEASIKGNKTKLIAVNEVNVHHVVWHALRFDVSVDGKTIKDVRGDGLIIATPFGSTAYFYSITRKTFDSGFAIAFNNPVKRMSEIYLKESAVVKVKINRGPGILVSDNNRKILPLRDNDIVTIKKAKQTAKIIRITDKNWNTNY